MKICEIATHNLYVPYVTRELNRVCDVCLILRKSKNEKVGNIYRNIKFHSFNKKSIVGHIKIIKSIKKVETNTDIFLIHYLNPYFALLLSLNIFKKPVAWLCYGSDIENRNLQKWIVKRALKKIDLIVVESSTQKRKIVTEYGIHPSKIRNMIWWSIDDVFWHCFEKNKDKKVLREKWGIEGKYVIFSPRALKPLYNHDILLRAIGMMKNKKDIHVVLSGRRVNKKYKDKLKKIVREEKLNVLFLNRTLTPSEMAELYSLSLINVNIPKHDGVARSIVEGMLCGSIPLLNSRIDVYREFFNYKSVVFVDPIPNRVAYGIDYVINNIYNTNNYKTFKKININIVSKNFDWKRNMSILYEEISKISGGVSK